MREIARELPAQTTFGPAVSQPAPWSNSNAVSSPAFGSVQLVSTRSVLGSTRKTWPSVVPTQSESKAATMFRGVPPTENVDASLRVRASIREIVPVPSFELITQTQSSEAATSVGVLPTEVTDVSSSDKGSMAPTEFGAASSAASGRSVRARTTATIATARSPAPTPSRRPPIRRWRRLMAIGDGPSPSVARAASTNSLQFS